MRLPTLPKRLVVSAAVVAVVFGLDSVVAKRGASVGCGDLALGDSLFTLRLTGDLHHAEYYERYGEAFYVDAQCGDEPVRYWLTYDWRWVSPRVVGASAIVDMKAESEMAAALLNASGFESPVTSLVPNRYVDGVEGSELVSKGNVVTSVSGDHEVYRYVHRNPDGQLLIDNLVVSTHWPNGA